MRIGNVQRSPAPQVAARGLTAIKIRYETADFNEAGPQVKLPDEGAKASRADERRAAIQFFTAAVQMAAKSYSADPPDQARTAMRIALAGVIKLISDLYPDEPSFPLPLIQLRYGLLDLDHGKVAPFLKPKKVSNSPGTSLSDDLFRAVVAAAMTVLMASKKISREEAGRDIAKRLSKMGGRHSSGKMITAEQIGKWREKMMTERAPLLPRRRDQVSLLASLVVAQSARHGRSVSRDVWRRLRDGAAREE